MSPPLALYVHLPWCVRKCPYCDFNSHPLHGAHLPQDVQARYLAALLADLHLAAEELRGRRIETVFFGGGTPSLFDAANIARLLHAADDELGLAPDVEITLEANPGTVEAARFRAFRDAGVNRLSLGVQSFDDAALARIGRIHDGAQARAALALAQQTFPRCNVDLIHALPGQTVAAALADVATALAAGVTHLSCYQLTIEPNTPFAHQPPAALPDHDASADISDALAAHLRQTGFVHYETSAFARDGAQCRHNLNYWRFGDYLGIGAGAHSKLTFSCGIVREARPQHPARYLAAAQNAPHKLRRRTPVAAQDVPFEFMMNALRLRQGVPRALFAERTGLSDDVLAAPLTRARTLGLLAEDDARLCASAHGQAFLNDLLALFLPDAHAPQP